MKVIIGLTGNIAAGKSTVSNILRNHGAIIVDADEVARKIVEKGEPALKEIIRTYGKSVINSDGTLNRSVLGGVVFNDPEQLEKLNRIMHPRIISQIKMEIDRFRQQSKHNILTIDAALLFETGLDKLVDQVWFVDTSKDLQVARLIKRDHYSREEALQRINAQGAADNKRRAAQVVIHNDGSREALENEVVRHIRNLRPERFVDEKIAKTDPF